MVVILIILCLDLNPLVTLASFCSKTEHIPWVRFKLQQRDTNNNRVSLLQFKFEDESFQLL